MGDFSTVDKFNSQNNYSVVKFGAFNPLLEVELNELQKIQNYFRNLLGSLVLSNGFINKTDVTYNAGTLTVPADTIVYDGEVLEIAENMSLTGLQAGDIVVLNLTEVEVDYNDSLYVSGNLSGGSALNNQILDARQGTETTRRIQKQVELSTTPAGDYLNVGTVSGDGTSFTDNRLDSEFLPARLPFVTGWSTFNSVTGAVITHNLGHQNYRVSVTPNVKVTDGSIGEITVTKADDTVTVFNSGADTATTFDYIVIPD